MVDAIPIAALDAEGFRLQFYRVGMKLYATFVIPGLQLSHRVQVEMDRADAGRLCSMIENIESASFLNAPQVYVTRDLAVEVQFVDVDEARATVTAFLWLEHANTKFRTYVGMRGSVTRESLQEFGSSLRDKF